MQRTCGPSLSGRARGLPLARNYWTSYRVSTHTHTHTHTHTQRLIYSHTQYLTCTHTHLLTHPLTGIHTLCPSLSFSFLMSSTIYALSYAMRLKSHSGPGATQEDKQLAVLW